MVNWQLLRESLELQRRCEQLTRQEAEFRGQLALYSEKFEEFQSTLTKSNEVFNTFKKEMDKVLPSLDLSYSLTDTSLCKGGSVFSKSLRINLSLSLLFLQMSKTISVLEKEMTMWRSKYEKCNKALIDTAEEVLYYYDIITFT